MSTRSITMFIDSDNDNRQTVILYHHYDGYPDGHGKDLAEYLAGITMRYGAGKDCEANGMPELAAMVIADFKARNLGGSVYLYPVGTSMSDAKFAYYVTAGYDTLINLRVVTYEWQRIGAVETLLFDGTPQQFLANVELIQAALDAGLKGST